MMNFRKTTPTVIADYYYLKRMFTVGVLFNVPDWLTLSITSYPDGRVRVSETRLYSKLSVYYTLYQVSEEH